MRTARRHLHEHARIAVIGVMAAALLGGCGGSPAASGEESASATAVATPGTATAPARAAGHREAPGPAKRSTAHARPRAATTRKPARSVAASRHGARRAAPGHAPRAAGSRRPTRRPGPATAHAITPRGTRAKLAFIAKADRICSDFRRRRDAMGSPPSSTSDRAAYYDKLGDLIATAAATMRQPPGPPALNHDVIVSYLAILDDNSAGLHRLADATRAGDKGEQTSLADAIRRRSDRANALVRAYGMNVCGA